MKHVKTFESFQSDELNEKETVKILKDDITGTYLNNKEGIRVNLYKTRWGDYRVSIVFNGKEMDQPVVKGKKNAISFAYNNPVAYIDRKDYKLYLDDKFKEEHPGWDHSYEKVKIVK